MGLFKKKNKVTKATPAKQKQQPEPTERQAKPAKKGKVDKATDIASLHAELDELRARLEATEWAKSLVDTRLNALDATTSVLAGNLAEATIQASSADATPTAPPDDIAPRLAELESLWGEVQAKLDAPPSSRLHVNPLPVSPDLPAGTHLDAEALQRLDALAERVGAVDELSNQFSQLAERVTASDHTARQTAEQVNALDARVSNIGTELANQLSELSTDIDALASRPASEPSAVGDEVIDALRAGQVRLANEQARYEIAFRQDLATLAEQVRKASGR